jgi:hypothetical protein
MHDDAPWRPRDNRGPGYHKERQGGGELNTHIALVWFSTARQHQFFFPGNERWVGMWKNKNREIEGERGLLLHARDLVRME